MNTLLEDNAPLPGASPLPSAAASVPKAEPWRAELEQSRLTLRMAEARAQALERQIDALNQRLRDSNEQLDNASRDLALSNEAANRTNARLASIIESSDDAIISKTLDGIITCDP